MLLLGYIVSKDGISADPAKVQAIADLPTPTKLSKIRTFLGMSGYYRQLVPNYAKISQALLELVKKNVEWLWTPERQQAFEKLKAALLSDVVLAYTQTDCAYKLYTDASDYEIGAILVQEDDHGVERVVHYLSIVYALQKLRPYLWGSKFKIITDHKPLKVIILIRNCQY